ncbi:hypothetical protein JGS6364_02871 [[Clostridium] sordellii]|uniref:Uncharacterized protein n=1 Tax=Paraclostridium sordellii TaxID=1505 RepID=A0A0A1S7A4_PARSO|nr:hypothetical protein [Paeniclostridium sordellii]EPZ62294.1 hypothetical protein H477_5549 [[Clostridium] sordellii ATCC 9714] [Paeniclostridium sordellii ATCC 9714]EPZ56753.1 hypothetical protein H476_2233 [[Clostridium] sordellii VPI 9048] [Paeniclostridium sordellii VPI 9048]MBS6025184.1 hypothetical protein [Paeniclostridium sordellii]MBX9181693.1 hypothetical protein [Paeniclostridium sordellii]MCH1966580.1 hypothetical protein [Paeniclostridium sordellii]
MKLSKEQLILKRDNRCIECGCKLNGLSYSIDFEMNMNVNNFKCDLCPNCLSNKKQTIL